METVEVYTDGSGNGEYGFCIKGGTAHVFHSKGITSNQAEYLAVLKAVESLKVLLKENKKVIVKSDSKLVVNQLNHKWNIYDKTLRDYAIEIWNTIYSMDVTFVWVPRKQNLAGKFMSIKKI